jgi:ABC-type transport system involved in cytochrome bd biosynthesis fused ATPase/permease subunit
MAYFRLLLLGLWLGAAIFFSAVVAPTMFGVLRGAQLANASELAGTMVTRLLSTINRGGFEIALFLLVTGYFMNKRGSRPARYTEAISLAIMAIMTGVSHWIISARMLALRAAMQAPIDQVAAGDPRRAAFDALHGYSMAAMGVALIAALIAFVMMSIQSRRGSRFRHTRYS